MTEAAPSAGATTMNTSAVLQKIVDTLTGREDGDGDRLCDEIADIVRVWLDSPESDFTPPEALSSHLIDCWCADHGGKIPWQKAVHITAIVTKMPDAERDRLLSL